MTGYTEREALAKLIYGAIAFHGGDPEHYEAMRDGIYHDAADAILAEFVPAHDAELTKRVRAEQGTWREAAVVVLEQVKINGRPALEVIDTATAIREASDD